MSFHRPQPILTMLSVLVLAALACSVPQAAVTTPTIPTGTAVLVANSNSPAPSIAPLFAVTHTPRPTAPPKVAKHRISTHRVYGIAAFYDLETSQNFIPRGVNYSILVPVQDHYENRLFAPGVYDHDRTRDDFAELSAAGYNTVRIVFDDCTSSDSCIGLVDGQGLNPTYLDNMADLMGLAKEAGLFLVMASQDLPEQGGYQALANQDASPTYAAGRNAEFLTQAGINASQKYWSDLLGGLASRQAPFDTILSWELMDEAYYLSDQPPFTLKTEKVTPVNGKTYYLFEPDQKKAMAVDGMRYYIQQVQQLIRIYDPTALVSMGFFAPDAPNEWREGDNRYVETAGLLAFSTLDFFDLHTDPAAELTLSELAENFGLDEHVSSPVMMGSVGASTWAYPEVPDGAIAIQDWIASSCEQGFSGWVYNGYYPDPAGLFDATWGFVDNQDYLLKALSPKNQPDACTPSALPGRNLALGKPVQVTEALPDQPAGMAVDGDFNTQWSAGAFPPQWIEVDLGAAYDVGEIRLTVGMWPAGDVVHELWVGANRDSLQKVHVFTGSEYDYDILDYLPASPLTNIRYVRLVTTESPSWVSWREIEVLAPFPATPTPTVEPSATPTP
jgi:hypothetical protein